MPLSKSNSSHEEGYNPNVLDHPDDPVPAMLFQARRLVGTAGAEESTALEVPTGGGEDSTAVVASEEAAAPWRMRTL